MKEEPAGWDGYSVRSDRMQIVHQQGHYIIVPHENDRPSIDRCPCCNGFMLSLHSAKVIANRVYPLTEG